ncbi:MAG: permease [Bacteroidota bacterium]
MEKTLGLLAMIGLGLLLQRKISSADHLKGIKVLILCVALPATIFVALLKVDLKSELLLLPLAALLLNGIVFASYRLCSKGLPALDHSKRRTLLMLVPSLAPGLSCFPFISEYLGEDSLAFAALADVGNKVFVLLILYLLAMRWYYQYNEKTTSKKRIKQLIVTLVSEPINLVILVALSLLLFGIDLYALPETISEIIVRLSGIMAPLILLFIGLAVKINRKDFRLIINLLAWRAGLMLMLSASVMYFAPQLSSATALLIIVFPQSACSFWPYAHMSAVSNLERGKKVRTFDMNFALSLLACSLPFSTLIILSAFSFQSVLLNPLYTLVIGAFLFAAAMARPGITLLKMVGFGKFWTRKKGEVESAKVKDPVAENALAEAQ